MSLQLHYRLDRTHHSVVAICNEPNCGWRDITNTRQGALTLLADHAQRAHRGLINMPLRALTRP